MPTSQFENLLKRAAEVADAQFERVLWVRSRHPEVAKEFEARLTAERRKLAGV